MSWSDTGLQMPQHHIHVMFIAFIQNREPLQLFLINHRHPDIRGEEEECSAERGRRNAEDGIGVLVHLHHTTNYTAIVLEVAVPIGVTEDEIGRTVWTVFICDVKEAAKEWLNA